MTVSTSATAAASPSPSLNISASIPVSIHAPISGVLPASLHTHVWRAGQMGLARAKVTATGHAALDRELPNQGWPQGGLIELLLAQSGIGELRLLQPALHALGEQRIVLLQPPHIPHIAAWRDWGLSPQKLLWIRTKRQADALWSAEQVLRNGSCGALLFWQTSMRHESLRRLQLAAQASDTLCWLMRPLAMADAPSPAPLRLALRPHPEGLRVDVLKRRGPSCTAPLLLQWPRLSSRRESGNALNAFMDRRLAAAVTAAGAAPALV